MQDTPATSPFAKTELLPIEDGYSKEGLLSGLRLADGKILINYERNTKTSVLSAIAKMVGAEVVVIKGTWTFTPAREESDGREEAS